MRFTHAGGLQWLRRFSFNSEVLRRLDALAEQITALSAQITGGFQMADATLQQISDDVAQETTLAEGITTMVTALLAKAAAVPGLTPEQQAQINAIAASVETNNATFAAALLAGTPPVPTPPAVDDVPPVA
jgi:hypothetical protein